MLALQSKYRQNTATSQEPILCKSPWKYKNFPSFWNMEIIVKLVITAWRIRLLKSRYLKCYSEVWVTLLVLPCNGNRASKLSDSLLSTCQPATFHLRTFSETSQSSVVYFFIWCFCCRFLFYLFAYQSPILRDILTVTRPLLFHSCPRVHLPWAAGLSLERTPLWQCHHHHSGSSGTPLWSGCHSQHSHLSYPASSTSLDQFSFLVMHCRVACGFITGRRGVRTTHLAVWAWTEEAAWGDCQDHSSVGVTWWRFYIYYVVIFGL